MHKTENLFLLQLINLCDNKCLQIIYQHISKSHEYLSLHKLGDKLFKTQGRCKIYKFYAVYKPTLKFTEKYKSFF
jgi:hypothetical protein